MGSFNDLPKDVVWLIFRRVINLDVFGDQNNLRPVFFESGCAIGFSWTVCVKDLATMSRLTFRLIQSKTVRVNGGFLFVKGSFS